MDSRRQQKFGKLIQKELSEIFLKIGKSIYGDVFTTVTHVTVSPDLGVAKIYLSFLMSKDNNATLQLFKENTSKIRAELGYRIKNQVRIIPELVFYNDDSASYAIEMTKIIDSLNIPEPPKEEDNSED
jgi:ribosome-binding factor A